MLALPMQRATLAIPRSHTTRCANLKIHACEPHAGTFPNYSNSPSQVRTQFALLLSRFPAEIQETEIKDFALFPTPRSSGPTVMI